MCCMINKESVFYVIIMRGLQFSLKFSQSTNLFYCAIKIVLLLEILRFVFLKFLDGINVLQKFFVFNWENIYYMLIYLTYILTHFFSELRCKMSSQKYWTLVNPTFQENSQNFYCGCENLYISMIAKKRIMKRKYSFDFGKSAPILYLYLVFVSKILTYYH